MENTKDGSRALIAKRVRRVFVIGIVLSVPVGATILILRWMFFAIDNVLQPLIRLVWGHTITGIGIGILVALIFVVGLIGSNLVGKRLIRHVDSSLGRIPVLGQLYTGIKQILEGFTAPDKTGFLEVVLVDFPRKGLKSIGLVTNITSDKSGKRLLNVYVPTSPNPTSGFLEIVNEEEVVHTKISVTDALKMVVSAGRVSSTEVGDRLQPRMG